VLQKKLGRIIRDGEKLQVRKKELSADDYERRLRFLKLRLDELLGWKNPNPILLEIIEKVVRKKGNILTFVEFEGVPSTNNYGEYTIKKGVLKRKISGGSMSREGANAYCVLVSIAQTCHLRGISFKDFLKASLVHYIRTGAPMKLSEFEWELNPERKAA
jgi:hypothetical protein